MGEPPGKVTNTFEQQYSSDVNAYFPSTSTIHVGDSVKWMPGFHTVDIPARGKKPLSLILANGPQPHGVNDAAGQPFWFNDKVPTFGFNPAVLKVSKSATYDGKKGIDSGLNAGPGQPSPFTVKFTKTGTYTYYCDVHPGMKGVVHVVAKTAKAPSVKDDKKAVTKQVNQALAVAKQLGQTVPPTATVQVGGAGKGGVEYYGFFGPKDPIKAGTTVTFQMAKGSSEIHTASTDTGASSTPPPAPGANPTIPDKYLADLSSTFQGAGPFDATATYSSDPAGGTPASLSPQLHGNGFWNSGVLDQDASSPLPSNATVRFDTPGSYTFYCLVHPFMHLTIQVQ